MITYAFAMAQGGQTEFTGTVTDAEGKAVGNVTCKLFDGKDSLLAYALTKSDGTYRLESVPEGQQIEFAFLGYETLRTPLQEGRTRYDARLERTAVELENVTVIADPITRRKDTLLYNGRRFPPEARPEHRRRAEADARHRGERRRTDKLSGQGNKQGEHRGA